MAAVAEKKLSLPKGKVKHRRQLPSKRSINLAGLGEKPLQLKLAIPAVVLIVLVAILFSKFLVIDRLAKVYAAQAQVTSLRYQLDAGYAELTDYDDLAELYAHYTYSGMTQAELDLTDRADVIKLIERVILPEVGVTSWSVAQNKLTVVMTANTLQEINLMAQKLEKDELVDYCTVSTAVSEEETRVVNYGYTGVLTEREVVHLDNVVVTAKVVIYLKSESEVNAG